MASPNTEPVPFGTYVNDINERIERGDRWMEKRLKDASPTYQRVARFFHKIGNGVDRTWAFFSNENLHMGGGFVSGALSGIVLGVILSAVAAAGVGIFAPLFGAALLNGIPVIIGASALIKGVLTGMESRQIALNSGLERTGDQLRKEIQEFGGSRPQRVTNPDLTHKQILQKTGGNPDLADQISDEYWQNQIRAARRQMDVRQGKIPAPQSPGSHR